MSPNRTRRGFVQSVTGATVAPILAGCGRRIYDAPDLRVRNKDVRDREIHVTVEHEGEMVVDETFSLRPKKQATVDTLFEETGTYDIIGSTDSGESNEETVEIEDLERDHVVHLTVREEPTLREGELVSIGRIAP